MLHLSGFVLMDWMQVWYDNGFVGSMSVAKFFISSTDVHLNHINIIMKIRENVLSVCNKFLRNWFHVFLLIANFQIFMLQLIQIKIDCSSICVGIRYVKNSTHNSNIIYKCIILPKIIR